MAVNIRFDSAGMPETPTFILAKKSGEKIGVLSNIMQLHFSDDLTAPSEFSFNVYKKLNGVSQPYWSDIRDFRSIYVPEWDRFYQITVEENENEGTNIKTVSGTALCEAELSQYIIYDTYINTEEDIARDDYKPTILYNELDPKASLLNRVISDKAPHYRILHVDDSLKKIQRTFEFNNISIYDAFQEIAEEIHCLFIFGRKDEINNTYRTISVYDLESFCNACEYRGEFTGKCPECGSTNIDEGFGQDTTIFLSSENLADDINYSTDTDSVKNCFRLVAGDDIMTSAVINSSPSGSQYIWNITDYMKEDMSVELVKKLESYDKDYSYYQKDYTLPLNSSIVSKYNTLINKYKIYGLELGTVTMPAKGYSELMRIYYDTVDFYGFLQNTLMPAVNTTEKTAKQQAALLTASNLSPVSVQNATYISLATANSAVLNYAKVYIDTARYKVMVKESSLNGKTWTGNFIVTSYTDEEDTADSAKISVLFNDDYENFLRQNIDKTLAKENAEDLSITALFKKNDTDFKNELKKYSLSYLQIFCDACQSCLDILIEQGVGDKDAWSSNDDLYTKLYQPYLNKLNYISQEMVLRENEIATVIATYDKEGDISSHGMQSSVLDIREQILKALDFEKYLGEFWEEFCAFRREDEWENDNYISDGLSNTEIFEKAQEFIKAAEKDLYKSSTMQHMISSNLKNLLVMEVFKPLRQYFSVGNWLRIQVGDSIYKLRLTRYELDFDSLENIDVEFSDVVQKLGSVSDIESILDRTQSMSSSFSSVKHQAEQGEESNSYVKNWVQNGLDATVTKIVNAADNQNVVYDRHGILVRKYDDISDSYSPTQLKITNSTLAVTTDNWETAKVGVGQFIYFDPRDKTYKTGYGLIADTIVGNIILSEQVGIYNEAGSMTFDTNGLVIKNDKNAVTINPNDTKLFRISKGSSDVLYVDDSGNLNMSGKIAAASGSKIGYWTVTDAAIYNTSSTWGASNGKYFGTNGLSITDKFKVDASGNLTMAGSLNTSGSITTSGNITATGSLSLAGGKLTYSNGTLSVSGNISTGDLTATGGKIADFVIEPGFLYNGIKIGTSGSCGISSGSPNGTDDRIFWAGDGVFRVDKWGHVWCSNIDVTGGYIGGWRITASDIYNDDNSQCAGIGKNGVTFAFWAGTTYANRNSAPFRVGHDGTLYASNANIGGSVNGISGTFTDLRAGSSEFHPTWILVDADGEGNVRIGTPDYKDWVDITIKPNVDNVGNIGTPDQRWSTIYSRVFSQTSVREKKEEIQRYNIDQAYDELKNMPLYTYYFKNCKPEAKTMSLGTMIDYLPSEVMMTTPNGNDCYDLGNLNFWHIAVTQVLQKKIEELENRISELEGK